MSLVVFARVQFIASLEALLVEYLLRQLQRLLVQSLAVQTCLDTINLVNFVLWHYFHKISPYPYTHRQVVFYGQYGTYTLTTKLKGILLLQHKHFVKQQKISRPSICHLNKRFSSTAYFNTNVSPQHSEFIHVMERFCQT